MMSKPRAVWSLNDFNEIQEEFSNLSKESNFYAVLSKLELISEISYLFSLYYK